MGCRASAPPAPASASGGHTPLFRQTVREDALHASGSLEILSDQEGEAAPQGELTSSDCRTSVQGGAKLLYPMYLMNWTVLMNLNKMMAHQAMRARGDLVEWSKDLLGRVILISHEWLGYTHPDPAGEQLRALQGVLRQLASGKVSVNSTWQRQLFWGDNEKVSGKHVAAVLPTCYFWLDFAGVPQELSGDMRERDWQEVGHTTGGTQKDMAAAISSIPAYVERSTLILVLTPTAQHQDVPERICGFGSWRGRGWCRVEQMASSLSRAHVRIMRCVGASAAPELLPGWDAFFLPPGEGEFTCCARGHIVEGRAFACDKVKIRDVLEDMLETAADHLRRVGKLLHHRYLICNKPRYLRGLLTDGMQAPPDLRQLLHWRPEDDALARAGRAPSLLHWAAIAGDRALLEELLGAGGARDAPMKDGLPEFGWPPGLRPVHLAVMSADGAPDASLALLDAGVDPMVADAGPMKLRPLHWVAALGTLEQLAAWMDRLPDLDLGQVDRLYGAPAVSSIAMTGSRSAPRLRLLLNRGADAGAASSFLGRQSALYASCWKEDSDPEAVRLLLDARCSPDMAARPQGRMWKAIYGIARTVARFDAFRGKQPGALVDMLGDMTGSTPLHAAARRGDVAVMKVLLAARADTNRRNDLGRTPLDLAVRAFGGVAPKPVEALLRGVAGADAIPVAAAEPEVERGTKAQAGPSAATEPDFLCGDPSGRLVAVL